MDTQSGGMSAMRHGLAGYIEQVAAAVGVAREGVTFEVSDTATAYLGLTLRAPERPERDLMLIWSERHGWAVALESEPSDTPEMAAYFGDDLVPAPAEVARFVTDVVTGHDHGRACPRFAVEDDRNQLTSRLARYVNAQR
ncbi:MAG: DUF6292 family protein [Sciscionella sp.]